MRLISLTVIFRTLTSPVLAPDLRYIAKTIRTLRQ